MHGEYIQLHFVHHDRSFVYIGTVFDGGYKGRTRCNRQAGMVPFFARSLSSMEWG
jgi:hypothetical protein